MKKYLQYISPVMRGFLMMFISYCFHLKKCFVIYKGGQMNQKNLIIVVILCIALLPTLVYAVPAAPMVHTLTQADGHTIQAKQWGDELSHGWETLDGYSILIDESSKNWVYATHGADGNLVSTLSIVGRDIPSSNIPQRLRPTGEARKKILSLKKSVITPAAVSPTGTANIPVLMVNFADRAPTFNSADVNSLLFGINSWSMKDYYEEVSYGAFSVSPGPMGVTGWYTALSGHDYYGIPSGSNKDSWPGDLVWETVYAADVAGFNFAPYDQDGDCYVDAVSIMHQGNGQESSGSITDIWSHRWSLNAAEYWGQSHYGEYVTASPCPAGGFIKVDDYVMQAETFSSGDMTTVGTFVHEYGHSLGLPDLYDTDISSNGAGNWTVMSYGVWNGIALPGDTPAHPDAWSKLFLGWASPILVSGTVTNEAISNVENNSVIYQLRDGTPTSGEYFLIENRQRLGFDSALPSSGLLIWHIDGAKVYSLKSSNSVNNNECYPPSDCAVNHYGVALIQADNLWNMEKNQNKGDGGDPFPGSSLNRSFSAVSLPNSNLYSGGPSSVSVTSISDSGSIMYATLTVDSIAPPAPISLNSTPGSWTNVNSFSIDWINPADDSSIAGAYYKLGSAPTSDTDGTYTTSKPFVVSASAQGGQTIYVWLKDSADNTSYLNRASTTLYYDGVAPVNGILNVLSSNAQVSLSWSGITDSGGSGLTATNTYKVMQNTGTYPNIQCTSGTQIYLGTGTSTADTGLINGTPYFYRVCAYDNAGNVSSGATAVGTPLIDFDPPQAPISLTVSPNTWTNVNSFTLNWTNPTDPSGIAGAYYKIGAAPTSSTDGTYTTSKPFTVTAPIEAAQTIYVWLKDGSGNVSHLNVSTATIYYDGSAPTGGSITATPNAGQVTLNWGGFSDAVSGLTSSYTYKVVRTTGSYPNPQCTSGSQIYLGTGTSLIETGLGKGIDLYYRVCAFDNAGNITAGTTTSVYLPVAKVLSPKSGDRFPLGRPISLNWENPSGTASVSLSYSINAGVSWSKIKTFKGAVTSYSWSLKSKTAIDHVKIRIAALNSAKVLIGEDIIEIGVYLVWLKNPSGRETINSGTTYRVVWDTAVLKKSPATVSLLSGLGSGAVLTTFDSITGNPGYYDWTVPTVSSPTQYKMQVVLIDSKGNLLASDAVDAPFTIVP